MCLKAWDFISKSKIKVCQMHKCKPDYFEMFWLRDIFCVSLWNWDCPGQAGTSGHAAYNAGWCGEVLVACFRLFWSSSDVCNFPLEHFPPLVISVDFSLVLVFCRSKCHSRCGLMWVWGLRGSFIHSVCLCSGNSQSTEQALTSKIT